MAGKKWHCFEWRSGNPHKNQEPRRMRRFFVCRTGIQRTLCLHRDWSPFGVCVLASIWVHQCPCALSVPASCEFTIWPAPVNGAFWLWDQWLRLPQRNARWLRRTQQITKIHIHQHADNNWCSAFRRNNLKPKCLHSYVLRLFVCFTSVHRFLWCCRNCTH